MDSGRWLLIPAVGLVLLVAYIMGVAWLPGGTAPRRVLHGSGCPQSEQALVEGPADRSPEDAAAYDFEPGYDWFLFDDYPELLPGSRFFGARGAERSVQAMLPWRVRFRIRWDSDLSVLSAFGSERDICMLARVVEHARSRSN